MCKRNLLFIFLSFTLVSAFSESYNYTNDGAKGSTIAFEMPKIITGEASPYLAQIIKNNLERVWRTYSGMQVIARDKMDAIIANQKKSQDALHSDASAIEGGNILAEQFSAYTTIYIRENKEFRLTIEIVDNKNGDKKVIYNTEIYEKEEDFTEYAPNEVALNVLPKLGVELSSMAKSKLVYRKNNENESLGDAKLHRDSIDRSIEALDKQLSEVLKTKMADTNAVAKKAQLQAEMERLRIEKKEADARVKRLEEDEKRAIEDAKKAKLRGAELNKKISENGKKYDRLAIKKRKEYATNLTCNARISLLEKKKQSLISLWEECRITVKNFFIEEERDYENKKKAIEDEPYALTDQDEKGRPTKDAKKLRVQRINNIKSDSTRRREQYLEEQWSILSTSYEAIRNEVNNDILFLKGQTEYSFLNSNLLRFGNYDGAKKAWVAHINLSLAGDEISSEKIFIPYVAVTGEVPKYKTETEKIKYNEIVEEYNAYFANNIPIIYVEINYDIIPSSVKKPSQYKVIINSYVFKKIDGDKEIYRIKARSSKKTLSITPLTPIDYTTAPTKKKLENEVLSIIKKEKKEAEKRQKELEAQRLKAKKLEAKKIEEEKKREKKEATKQNEMDKNEEAIKDDKKESTKTDSSSIKDSVFGMGYFPIGCGLGFSKTYAPASFNMGIDIAYLFYTEYIDVGPEIKFSLSPISKYATILGMPQVQVDFGFAAKVQKKVYEDLYVAGDAGFDFLM